MATPITIRLTPAQRSALECAGIDDELPVLQAAWDGANALRFAREQANDLWSELTDRANGEDGNAEHATDADMRRYARSACRSITTLASQVARRADASKD